MNGKSREELFYKKVDIKEMMSNSFISVFDRQDTGTLLPMKLNYNFLA